MTPDDARDHFGSTTITDSIDRCLRDEIRQSKFSAVSLTEAFFREIEKKRDLNIFITTIKETALRQAEQSDGRLSQGNPLPLDGIPIAVKDNFCTEGVLTTAGSAMLESFVPTYESTVTAKLKDAGAVILGKTNLDEFAMGSSTESSYFGPTINPRGRELDLADLAPGGSSGGSAAAVAANVAAAAIGTDTGGSIRQPASFCGVVGFKPSYGVCSRWGIVAYASSLDQAGVFSKSVKDNAIVMDVISGQDPNDSTSLPVEFAFEKAAARPSENLRIGFPREVLDLQSTRDAKLIWSKAEDLANRIGAEVVEVSLPNFKHALPSYYLCALSEASSNLARYDGVRYGHRCQAPKGIVDMYERTRNEGFGAEVRKRILLGTFALSTGYYDAYYLRALKVRNIVSEDFKAAFKNADVMFMPTCPSGAFEIGAHNADPLQMYLEDVFTVPINMAGLPSISIPVSLDHRGMPLGLQIVGPQLGDEKVFSVATMVEDECVQLS